MATKPKSVVKRKNNSTTKSSQIERIIRLAVIGGQVRDPREDGGAAIARLRSSLTRLWKGQGDDLVAPFFGLRKMAVTRQEIVKAFLPLIKVTYDQKKVPRHIRVLLELIESDNLAKVGSKSQHLGYGHYGDSKVGAVFSDKDRKPVISEETLLASVNDVIKLANGKTVQEWTVKESIDSPPNAKDDLEDDSMDFTTAGGAIDYITGWWPTNGMSDAKRLDAEKSKRYILGRIDYILKRYAQGEPVVYNALVGVRNVSKGQDWTNTDKTRVVLALEKAEVILARRAVKPITDMLRMTQSGKYGIMPFASWNDTPVIDMQMQKLLQVSKELGYPVLAGDWSGFDASIPPWLFKYAAMVLEAWCPTAKWIQTHIHSLTYGVRLLTPTKIWEPQPSSVKSGSGFTSLIGGVLNLLVLYYGKNAGDYDIDAVSVMGDDFVLLGDGVNPQKISDNADRFGMVAHPDKQLYVYGALQFLQRLHIHGWPGGIYSVIRTLNSILSYEKTPRGKGAMNEYSEAIRAISQLENAAFNPAFDALVRYMKTGDKFHLGADIPATEVIARATDEGLKFLTETGNYGRKSKDLITSWGSNVTNGTLRGEQMLRMGSMDRFSRVYGNRTKSLKVME
jgi:hypothetical protein